nr:hypothetical protein [Bacteroidota bacterium]
MDNKVILTTQNELAEIVIIGAQKALAEYEAEKAHKSNCRRLTINQVAKRLHRAHTTIKKYVDRGLITVTADGRVLESELIRFLDAEK